MNMIVPTPQTGRYHSRLGFDDCALFKAMSEVEYRQTITNSRQIRVESGSYLFHQNAEATKVYNVISGVVSVERFLSNGRRQIVALLFPGDFLGLTNSDHYDLAARCLTDASFYEFKRKRLYDLAEQMPSLKTNIKDINVRVLNRILDQVYILGQKKAHERLCFLFQQLLERQPGARADRTELHLTRQDMADYLGLTIETVSRSLAKLKSDGVIRFPSLTVLEVIDMDQMIELADT